MPDQYSSYDCRLFERIPVELAGEMFFRGAASGIPCRIHNIAASGARIESDTMLAAYTPLTLYVEGFGRFECVTVPGNGPLTGVMFILGQDGMKAHSLRLADLKYKNAVGSTRLRRYPRNAANGRGHYRDAGGRRAECELLDISEQGASLRTPVRPPVGGIIRFGTTLGRVVRHHDDGIGIFFLSATAE